MASKKSKGMAIIISIMDKKDMKKMKNKKAKMAYGGMAGGKKHMYSPGGSVTDNLPNKGLRSLAKSAAGRKAVRNMGFDV